MHKFSYILVGLLLVTFLKVSEAHDQFIGVIAEAKPSVVIIEVVRSKRKSRETIEALGENANFFQEDLKKLPNKSRGSGFIIQLNQSNDGFLSILTAAHVVKGASKIKVILSDGKRKSASLVWLSLKDDVALLKIDNDLNDYGALELSAQAVVEGQSVLSIAGSFDLSVSSSLGIISAVDVVLPGKKKLKLIQTDAAINPGSSGGALLNANGQVVGLISNIYTKTGAFSGAAFAVPALTVKQRLLKQKSK